LKGLDKAWLLPELAQTNGGKFLLWGGASDWQHEQEQLQRNGIFLLQAELDAHNLGFERRLLTDVVPDKRRHPRLLEAFQAKPHLATYQNRKESNHAVPAMLKTCEVLDAELWAGLIYTGTDAQGDIRRWLRLPVDGCSEACDWKWTIIALKHLAVKLAEEPPTRLFHGLNNVLPPSEAGLTGLDPFDRVMSYNNLVSGSMSLPMARIFALGEGGTVVKQARRGLVMHIAPSPHVVVADMRWISKFPTEEEWLMVPCLHCWAGIIVEDYQNEVTKSGAELVHMKCTFSI